ncbi:MAG: response regulator [Thermodesulfobacteriota bacterium]
MPKIDPEFIRELRQAFALEAREHLQTMTDGLLGLEKSPPPAEAGPLLERVYRAAHSLKGAARAVNEHEVESLAHAMEDVFIAVRKGGILLRPEDFDRLQRGQSLLESLLASPKGEDQAQAQDLREELRSLAEGRSGASPPPPAPAPHPGPEPPRSALPTPPAEQPSAAPAPAPPQPEPPKTEPPQPRPQATEPPDQTPPTAAARPRAEDTVRVAVSKLDSFLLKAEALLLAKLTLEQRIAEVRALAANAAQGRKDLAGKDAGARRPEAEGPPDQMLARGLACLDATEAGLVALASRLRADHLALGGMVRDLLDNAKRALMFPFATLALPFPKMVRDLARDQRKEADLVISGGEIEIDKRILEAMKPPLTHMLRNCVDHGLEPPGERERRGKPRQGRISITVSEAEGDKAEIVVADDGAGFDLERLRQSARKILGISQEEAERLGEDELTSLAFRSGVSTSTIITDISGRGLGLAIVQEAAERLGGRITLSTATGQGSTLRILLPLTLATFRGILVRAAGRIFVAPTANISRVVLVRTGDIRTAEGREVVALDGRPCSLARLADVLGLSPPEGGGEAAGILPSLLLGAGKRRLAMAVDEVLGEQDVLVKGLGKHLAGLRNISGATILGTGEVAPVLNVADLLDSAARTFAPHPRAQEAQEEERPRSVLVVEDSITSRTLLKNILQSAGYQVRTAIDGVDGLTVLRSEPVDLAVLDIDMPRMDGFELTTAIRQDKKLAELPVVLVTARGSREDRERGIELGANAYIVKSSFDQTNLLGVIRQLI